MTSTLFQRLIAATRQPWMLLQQTLLSVISRVFLFGRNDHQLAEETIKWETLGTRPEVVLVRKTTMT